MALSKTLSNVFDSITVTWCCSGYHWCTTSFSKAWTVILCKLTSNSCWQRVWDRWWWEYLTIVAARNKVKDFSSINHSTKTIDHLSKFCKHEQNFFWRIHRFDVIHRSRFQYKKAKVNNWRTYVTRTRNLKDCFFFLRQIFIFDFWISMTGTLNYYVYHVDSL